MSVISASRVGLTWSLLVAIACAGLDVRGLAADCSNKQAALTPCGAATGTCCCGAAAHDSLCGSVLIPLVIGRVVSKEAAADLGRNLLSSRTRSIQTLLCVWRS